MFILINSDDNLLVGVYTTLELAKSAHACGVANKKNSIPRCSIMEVVVDNVECIDFFGGYQTYSRWELGSEGEWIELE